MDSYVDNKLELANIAYNMKIWKPSALKFPWHS